MTDLEVALALALVLIAGGAIDPVVLDVILIYYLVKFTRELVRRWRRQGQ